MYNPFLCSFLLMSLYVMMGLFYKNDFYQTKSWPTQSLLMFKLRTEAATYLVHDFLCFID